MRAEIKEQIHDLLSELSMCWSAPEKAGTFDQPRFMRTEDRIFSLLEMSEEEWDARLEEQREIGNEEAKEEAYEEAKEDLFVEIVEDLTAWLEKQKSQRLSPK